MFKFFLKGGPLMWPILLCSVISITITLERFYHFYRARTKIPNIFARVKRFLQEGKADEALKLCEEASGPIAHILAIGIHIRNRSLEEKEKLLAKAGSRIIRQFDRHLNGLAIISNITPLLGLLGTVTGMIKAFMKIQELGGRVDASVLAGGIWEALITTAFGLSIAIPTLVAYHYFESRVDNVNNQMKDAATEFLEMGHVPAVNR
ncbi:MAG TPA: MotA/TolQ/ExbB proton channel family protein [Candidatus Omnitrophica bacterium]|nr:MotA/TolQ/ExbB proton channel family protein [Candidatus Omnitrophota bacterium]